MRMRFTAPILALTLLTVAACGGDVPDPKSAGSKSSSGGSGSGVKVGQKAPTFNLASLNGQGNLEIKSGKVTIVDFWATWCEPCKKSFPKLQELYVKYKASGVEIVAVSVDDEKNGIPDFAKTYGAKFPVGWDDGKKVAEKWKPEKMPSSFIIGKDGVVKHVHEGYHDGEELEIDKELKALL